MSTNVATLVLTLFGITAMAVVGIYAMHIMYKITKK